MEFTPIQSGYWDNIINKAPFYYDAFHSQEHEVWGGTKFAKDLLDLTYYHSLVCWVKETPDDEEDRRILLKSYLKPDFSYDEDTDLLNQGFPKLPTDNSYINRVLRNLCYIYNTKPYRTFKVKEKEIEELSARLGELLEEMKYDWYLQKIYRLAKFTNEVAVRPLRRNEKLTLDIITPDSYRKIYDDFGTLIELWIPFPMQINGKWEQCFNVWTKDLYRVANNKGDFISFKYPLGYAIVNGTSQGIKNPYGRIPYVFLELNNSEVYGGSMFELLKAQLFANKLTLLIDENVTFNGFSMFVATNINKAGQEKVKISPRHVFNISNAVANDQDPIPPTLDTISPAAQYDQIQLYKDNYMKSVLKNMGLPISMIENETGTVSGIAILRERQELTDAQEEDKTILISFENELINLIAEVQNIEVVSENYPEDISVEINYADIKALEEPSVMFETEKAKFEYGLVTAREFVQAFTDVDFNTNQEAIDFIKENRDLLKQLRGSDESSGTTEQRIPTAENVSRSSQPSDQTSTIPYNNPEVGEEDNGIGNGNQLIEE